MQHDMSRPSEAPRPDSTPCWSHQANQVQLNSAKKSSLSLFFIWFKEAGSRGSHTKMLQSGLPVISFPTFMIIRKGFTCKNQDYRNQNFGASQSGILLVANESHNQFFCYNPITRLMFKTHKNHTDATRLWRMRGKGTKIHRSVWRPCDYRSAVYLVLDVPVWIWTVHI